MARQTKKTEEKNYNEYNMTGENGNDIEARVYKEPHSGDKGAWHGISITINGVTIKGAKLWIPLDEKKDMAILWPSYKDKDGKNQPYIALFDEKDRKDLDAFIGKAATDLGY